MRVFNEKMAYFGDFIGTDSSPNLVRFSVVHVLSDDNINSYPDSIRVLL